MAAWIQMQCRRIILNRSAAIHTQKVAEMQVLTVTAAQVGAVLIHPDLVFTGGSDYEPVI